MESPEPQNSLDFCIPRNMEFVGIDPQPSIQGDIYGYIYIYVYIIVCCVNQNRGGVDVPLNQFTVPKDLIVYAYADMTTQNGAPKDSVH